MYVLMGGAAYYYRKGEGSGKDKWIIFFDGGGWCRTLEDCHMRSFKELGSSKEYKEVILMDSRMGKGVLSDNPEENPDLYNWNTIFVRYCDGEWVTTTTTATTTATTFYCVLEGDVS